jgi:hypothetical protein
MSKQLNWIEAAEIAGMSVRKMRRKRQACIYHGYNGLFDRRRGKNSYHRLPMATAARSGTALIVSQSDHRIDANGAPGRNQAAYCSCQNQYDRRNHEREWIIR